MIFILNRQEKVVATIKNSGGVFNTPPFFDDILTQDLPTGAETFTFTTPAKGSIARSLIVGNFVAFKKDNEYKLFQIMRTEESHEDAIYITVYSECAGLELINKVFRKTTINSCTLKQFMTTILQDTGWDLGCLPLNQITLDLVLEDASVYEIIQNTLAMFGVELEFSVEINQSRISKKIINVYGFRGKVTGKRFEFGQDINAIQRTIDSTELYTALIGKGKDNINFSEVTVEGIDKPLGQDFIADQESFNRYNHNGYHIMGVFEYDTTSPEELLRETYKALQKTKIPKVTYEVDVALLGELLGQSWNNVSIGDTVAIVDNAFNPPINLMARVAKLETSFTNPQSNKCTLTNFIEVKSNITDEMRKLAGMLEGYVDNSLGNKFPIGSDDILDGAVNGDKIYKETIKTDHLIADCVTADKIKANSITAGHIVAGSITADKIDVNFIQGVTGQFENIFADIARIDHIFAGNITADMLAAGTITGGSGVIGDASIGSAQISELTANKIRAGTLDTSLVNVASKDGEIEITGYQVLVHDTTDALNKINRVVLGKYKKGENFKYGLVVRGEDGQTIMLDEQGVHNAGITSGAVDDNKIADDASIKGWKLDINSVIRSINEDGTELIAGTIVRVGDRTLEVELSTQKNLITDNKKQLETQKSQIIALDNKIQLKVDNQTFTEAISQVNQKTLEEVAKAKTELKKELSETNTALENLGNQINGAFKDGIISEVEAITIRNNIQQLEREKLDLHEQYLSIYNNQDISTSARNNLYQAKQEYETKHAQLIDAINKAIEDMKATSQEATNVNNKTKAYSTSLAQLSKRMNEAIDSIVTTRTEGVLAQALKEIEQAKSDVKLEINDVNNSLGDLNTTINTTFKDGVLSENECTSIAERIKQLDKEMEEVNGKYTNIYNHRLLSGVVKTNLYNAKQDVDAKSVALKNAINTAIQDKKATSAEKTDIDSKMLAYGKSLSQFSQKINDAIDFISTQKSDNTLADAIKKINESKNLLQGEINDVSSRIDDLILNVDGIIKDNIINEAEAIILENNIKQLDKEKADLDKQYLAIYSNTSLNGDAKTNLASAKTSYDTTHTKLKKAIQDAIANKKVTDEEKTNINSLTSSYSTSFALFSQRLTEALDAIIDTKTNNALASAIEKINQAKQELKQEIKDVNNSLGSLSDEIHSSFHDGVISEVEAIAIKENLRRLGIEKLDLDKQYTSIYSNSDLAGSAKTNLYNAKVTFDVKHNELVKAIETAIADGNATSQEKALVDTKTTEYSNALSTLSQRLNEAIDNIATNKSNSALSQALAKIEEAKRLLKSEISDVITSVGNLSNEIHTSFKDGVISESETLVIGNNIQKLDIEKADLDKQYSVIYSNSDLTGSAKTNLYNAKVDFDAKHLALKSSIQKAIEDKLATPTEKTDVDNKTKAYAISLATLSQRLNEAINNIASNKADGALSEAIIKINEAKKLLMNEVLDIHNRIDDLILNVDGAIKDGIIDEMEAIMLENDIKQLDKEKLDLDKQYSVIYSNSDLTGSAKTNLASVKTTFDTNHAKLKQAILDAIANKMVNETEKNNINNLTKTYSASLALYSQRLNEAIDNIATNKANSALSQALAKIEEAKSQLRVEIGQVSGALDSLESNVNGAFKDGVVSEAETLAIKENIKRLQVEKADVDKKYTTIYSNSDLSGNSKTNLYNAKSSFDTSHTNLIKSIETAIQDKKATSAEKTDIDSKTNVYSTNLANLSQRLEEAIDSIASKKTDDALAQALAKIEEAKRLLKSEIQDVSNSLSSLDNEIKSSFKDGIISEVEVIAIKESLKSLDIEKKDVDKKYTSIYGNSDLTGVAQTNLYYAKKDYDTKHTDLKNAINSAITDKVITSQENTNVTNKTNSYAEALGLLSQRLNEAIDAIATKKNDNTLAETIAKINEAKQTLKVEINDIKNSLSSLESNINGAFHDGIISEAEAIAIAGDLKQLDKEKEDVDSKVKVLNDNLDLTGIARTNLENAKSDYNGKHTTLKQIIQKAIADGKATTSEKMQVDDATLAYSKSLSTLSRRINEAIDAIASKKTQDAIISSNEYTDGQVTIVTKKLEKATAELKILQDQISMKVEEVEIKTTKLETTVKNLNVGSRNLIRNSGEFKNLDFWNSSNANLVEGNIRASGTLKNNSTIKLEANKDYIYSVELKPTRNLTVTETNLLGYEVVTNLLAEPRNNWNINTVNNMQSKTGWDYVHFSVDRNVTLSKCETRIIPSGNWRTENLISTGSNSYKCYIYCYEGDTNYNIRLTDNQGNSKISNDFLVTTNPIKPPPDTDNAPNISSISNASANVSTNFSISYSATDDKGINKHEFSDNNGSSYITINPNKNGNNYSYTRAYSTSGIRNCRIRVTDTKNQTTTSNMFTITINAATQPDVDNVPNIDNVSNINNYVNESFYINYTTSDDNGITRHEFSDNNGSSFVSISPSQNGNNCRFVKNYSTAGTRNCKIRVFDSKNQSATSNTFSIKITDRETNPPPAENNPPVVSIITVSKQHTNGSYTLNYSATDQDGDSLAHKLKIDNSNYELITPTKSGSNYTYNGNGMSSGRHTCYIQVDDSKTTTHSKGFVVEIPSQVASDNLFQTMEIVSEKNLEANKFTRVILKLRTKSSINENYRLNPIIKETNTFYVKNAQFEVGNKASNWKPSDLDIEQQLSDSISQSKDYTDSQVTIVDTKISSANSEIVLLKDKITQTVTKNEFNSTKLEIEDKILANKTEISNNKAEIIQTTDGIKQQVSNLNSTTTTIQNNLTGVTEKVNTVSNKVTTLEASVGKITAQVSGVEVKVESTIGKVTNLEGSINSVSQSVNNLNSTMNGAFKDGVLSSAESIAIKEQIILIDREKADLDKKYDTLYNNSDLAGNAKTELYNAKNSYNNVHNSLKSIINSAITDSQITTSERNSVNSKLSEYSTSLATLSEKMNKAINDIATNKSNSALSQAVSKINEAKSQLQGSINSVSSSVSSLNSTMNGAFKDGVLNSSECLAIEQNITQIDKEKADLDKKYDTLYNNSDLAGNAKTELYNAKNSYNTNHLNLKNSINTAISDKQITTSEKNNINSNLNSYSASLATLSEKMNKAIDAISTKKSLDAVTSANEHTNSQVITINDRISGIVVEQDKINSTVGTVQIQVNKNKDSVGKLQTNMVEVNTKVSNIEQTNTSITSTVGQLTNKTDGMQTQMNSQGSQITQLSNQITNKVNVDQVESMLQQTEHEFNFKFQNNGSVNLVRNGRPRNSLKQWEVAQKTGNTNIRLYSGQENHSEEFFNSGIWWEGNNGTGWCRLDNKTFSEDNFSFSTSKKYSLKMIIYSHYTGRSVSVGILSHNNDNVVTRGHRLTFNNRGYHTYTHTFTPSCSGFNTRFMIFDETSGNSNIKYFIPWISIVEGETPKEWTPHFAEIMEGNTVIDRTGIQIFNGGLKVHDNSKRDTLFIDNDGLVASNRGLGVYGDGGIHFNDRGMWQVSDSHPIFVHTNDRFETLKKNGTSWCKLFTGELRLSHTATHANGSKYCRIGNNYDGAEELELYDFHRGRRLNMSANRVWFTDLAVSGSKNRVVDTSNHGTVALHATESTSPIFTDLGEGKIVDGECTIFIDPVFAETINTNISYQVFTQKYGQGDIWVEERNLNYFIVKGTENLKFGWEIKAHQRDYETDRLNQHEKRLEPLTDVEVSINNELYQNTLYEIDKELNEENLESIVNDFIK